MAILPTGPCGSSVFLDLACSMMLLNRMLLLRTNYSTFCGAPRAVKRAGGAGCPQRRAGLDTFGYGRMNGIEAFCPSRFQTASSTAFHWSGIIGAIANGQAPVWWKRDRGRNRTNIL